MSEKVLLAPFEGMIRLKVKNKCPRLRLKPPHLHWALFLGSQGYQNLNPLFSPPQKEPERPAKIASYADRANEKDYLFCSQIAFGTGKIGLLYRCLAISVTQWKDKLEQERRERLSRGEDKESGRKRREKVRKVDTRSASGELIENES